MGRISDAKALELRDAFVEWQNVSPVFLWTKTNHDILDNLRVLGMEFDNFRVSKDFDGWNTVEFRLREVF